MAENTDVLTRFTDQCWNARNANICWELLASDFEHYMPGADEPTVGPGSYQQLVDGFLAGFPDTSFIIEDAFGEGDRVCMVWTARGTHRGEFNGIPATGNSIVIPGVAVARVANGKITRIVSVFDNDSFMKQLDASGSTAAEHWKKTSRI